MRFNIVFGNQKSLTGRENDLIGLITFSRYADTILPLTLSHGSLKGFLDTIVLSEQGSPEDGTAIGMGISNGISRLMNSEAESKIIILITDGKNTKGEITPMTAAEIAKKFNIKIYTIAVGTKGLATYPFKYEMPNGEIKIIKEKIKVEIDEESLQDIAAITNGKFYRATNNETLKKIYLEIDKLEKSLIEVKEYYKKKNMYMPFALIALILLSVEFILKNSIYKSLT